MPRCSQRQRECPNDGILRLKVLRSPASPARHLNFVQKNGNRLSFLIFVQKNGNRLSFLIVEAEPSQGLSTRKLLIESAKHNVLTAYSAAEGSQMLKRFPRVDAVVIDEGLKGNERLAKQVRDFNSDMRIVCLSPHIGARSDWADETINSHDPAELLKLLEKMGGRTDI